MARNKIMANVHPINLKNKWFKPALLKDVISYEGFTGENIAKAILTEFNKLVTNDVFFNKTEEVSNA